MRVLEVAQLKAFLHHRWRRFTHPLGRRRIWHPSQWRWNERILVTGEAISSVSAVMAVASELLNWHGTNWFLLAEKNELKPWLKECWCIPPKANAEFVCAMEDVLEVYHRQFEDNEVLVCLDETSKQQVRETRTPLAPRPGTAMAYDYEYERNGGEQPVYAVRALGGVAAGGGDGPAEPRLTGPGWCDNWWMWTTRTKAG